MRETLRLWWLSFRSLEWQFWWVNWAFHFSKNTEDLTGRGDWITYNYLGFGPLRLRWYS